MPALDTNTWKGLPWNTNADIPNRETPGRMIFQECPSSCWDSRRDSPLSSWEFLRSIQVQLSYFFGCLNYTIGVLYVYQPFHSFALLLRFKNKRKVKKLSHTQPCVVAELSKRNATHPKSKMFVLPDSKTIDEPRFPPSGIFSLSEILAFHLQKYILRTKCC